MKNRGLFVSLLCLTAAMTASAQTSNVGQGYQSATLYKVPWEKRSAFLDQMKLRKAIWQQGVNSGHCRFWGVYEVQGAGAAGDYNFVAITSYDRWPENETASQWPAWVKQAGVSFSASDSAMWAPFVVRSVISRTAMRAGVGLKPGEFLAVRRFRANPGKGNMLETAHREQGLPAMLELIQQGKVKGHSVTFPVFSGSSALPYSYSVSMGFATRSAAITGVGDIWAAAFAKANPGKNSAEYMKLLNDNRQPVRAELWRLVDGTERK